MLSFSLCFKLLESISRLKAERRVARDQQKDKFFKGNAFGVKTVIRKRGDK